MDGSDELEGSGDEPILPLWRGVLIAALLAMIIDAGQYLVLPCNIKGWSTPAVGFAFFFCGLLFLLLVSRRGLRLLSMIPLVISVVTALPWFLSHMCP
jgi:hypothetical protein